MTMNQVGEKPREGKLSSAVLKTSRVGDCPAEFNSYAVLVKRRKLMRKMFSFSLNSKIEVQQQG